MNRSIRAVIVGLTFAGVVQTTSAATLEKSSEVRQRVVFYGDLDLQKDAGAATLLKRLTRAAADVCAMPTTSAITPHKRRGTSSCREGALQTAVETVNHPVVTTKYQSSRMTESQKLAVR